MREVNASNISISIAQAGSTGFTSNIPFVTRCELAAICTYTPAISTVNGAPTLVLTTNQWALWYSDNSNYFALVSSAGGGGSISGSGTTGFVPKFTTSTAIGNTLCDEGISKANTFTCNDSGGMAMGSGTTAIFTSEGANQNVEIGSGNGAGDDSGSGTVLVQNAMVSGGAFSTLATCSSTNEGRLAKVTDSTTATWGATITGSGTNHVLAYCDATNWTVAGK